uniref:AAA_lid_8 domain-containing protein n=1 Tax=Rhabditophanes sp. KR3021 TaxID=114890 RepID=A0AC35TSN6_9BILA
MLEFQKETVLTLHLVWLHILKLRKQFDVIIAEPDKTFMNETMHKTALLSLDKKIEKGLVTGADIARSIVLGCPAEIRRQIGLLDLPKYYLDLKKEVFKRGGQFEMTWEMFKLHYDYCMIDQSMQLLMLYAFGWLKYSVPEEGDDYLWDARKYAMGPRVVFAMIDAVKKCRLHKQNGRYCSYSSNGQRYEQLEIEKADEAGVSDQLRAEIVSTNNNHILAQLREELKQLNEALTKAETKKTLEIEKADEAGVSDQLRAEIVSTNNNHILAQLREEIKQLNEALTKAETKKTKNSNEKIVWRTKFRNEFNRNVELQAKLKSVTKKPPKKREIKFYGDICQRMKQCRQKITLDSINDLNGAANIQIV